MFHFLRLAGVEATLHISVLKQEASGRLRAHCWITSDGRTVSSPPDPSAAEVLSYPAVGRTGTAAAG